MPCLSDWFTSRGEPVLEAWHPRYFWHNLVIVLENFPASTLSPSTRWLSQRCLRKQAFYDAQFLYVLSAGVFLVMAVGSVADMRD